MNSDGLASSYRLFEYAAFWRRLEHHRFRYLPAVRSTRRALLLGDGDGRFLVKFASECPLAEIDCIESSGKMIDRSQQRLRSAGVPDPDRVHFMQVDARNVILQEDRYDLVVTNFFLDCFSTVEVQQLCDRVARACRNDARWIVSEFQQPVRGWQAWHARLWLRSMYAFFRLTTGLLATSLPDYAPGLGAAGFHREFQQLSMAGLIASELWVRNSNERNATSLRSTNVLTL